MSDNHTSKIAARTARWKQTRKQYGRRLGLTIEMLEERDLLARLVPLTALVAGDLTHFEGEYVHSNPTQDPPIESHSCEEDHSLRIGFPRADRSARASAGESMTASSLGLPFHRDPITQIETYSSQVFVGGGIEHSDSMFEFGVFGNVDSSSYEVIYEDDIEETYRPCSRIDQATFSAGGAAAMQILPGPGEKFGDAVGIEVFASVTQLVDFEPESDPSPDLDATASFVYASGEALVELVANDDENPASFEGVARIGDVFAFSVGLAGDLVNTELFEQVNLNAAAGGSVFIRDLDPLKVSAEKIPSNGPSFQNYLPGVTLVETFTITVDAGVADYVKAGGITIAFAEPGFPAPEIERDGDGNTWTFELEMGMVPEDSAFTIVVAYEGGATQQFTGDIDILEEPLKLELTMRPGVANNDFSDIEDLRLITDIPLPTAPAFRATISNLPASTRAAYRDRIDLVRSSGSAAATTFQPSILFGATNQFFKSVSNLTAGTHRFELMPSEGAQTREVKLSNELELLVIDLPGWMEDFVTDKDFAAGGELATVLETPNAAGYVIQLRLPDSGTPMGSEESFLPDGLDETFSKVFESLRTNVGASLELTVYASLAHTRDAIVKGGKWSYKVTILGKDLVQPTEGTAPEGLSGVLAGKDLSFKGLGYKETGIDLIGLIEGGPSFNLSLGGGTIVFPVPSPIPGTKIDATWSAALSAVVDTLSMDVVLKVVKAADGKIVFDDSRLTFNAKAHAIATLNASAELGVFGVIDIAEAVVTGQFRLDLNAKLQIDLDGPVTDLDSISVSPLSYGRLTPSYDIRWKLCVFEDNCQPDPVVTEVKDCDPGTFGIGAPLPCAANEMAKAPPPPKTGPAKSPDDIPEQLTGQPGHSKGRATDVLLDRLGRETRPDPSERELGANTTGAMRVGRFPLADAALLERTTLRPSKAATSALAQVAIRSAMEADPLTRRMSATSQVELESESAWRRQIDDAMDASLTSVEPVLRVGAIASSTTEADASVGSSVTRNKSTTAARFSSPLRKD